MTDGSILDRLHYIVRARISEHPALYLPLARRKYPGPSPEVIGPDTEFVIDGYTRSASTFAVYAFQLAQRRPVRLAHHLHAPAQIIAAARASIPTLVVIRDPEGAILSQVVREPLVHLRDALVSYLRFYSCLLPHLSGLVIADFNEITRDFGAVTQRINERFGTSFAVFDHTEANVQRCLDLMADRPRLPKELLEFESGLVTLDDVLRAQQSFADKPVVEADDAWVPSADRRRSKDALRARWSEPRLEPHRRRAELVYAEFLRRP